MTRTRTATLCLATWLALFISLAGPKPTAEAAFHLWQVKEVFTNAAGTVQFVEMFDSNSGENAVSGFTLRANSDGVIKNFVFPASLVGTTTNKHMLIATFGFGSLPGGVTPDFTFDQSTTALTLPFFNPNATNITITFTGSNDSMTFAGATLPKNGINSLTDANAFGLIPNNPTNIGSTVNSPTNFSTGASGSVTPPTGDYNGNHQVDAGDYVVWRKTFNNSISPAGLGADGDASATIDTGDYTYWRARFGNAAGSGTIDPGSTVPEPVAGILLLAAFSVLGSFGRRR